METHTVRALVVDDDAAARQSCRAVLDRLFAGAVRVREAASPEQAMLLLREEEPHLVLADYVFPSALSGIDLLEAAARERPGAMRILMTAYPAAEILVEATNRAHVHGFIPKPARPDALEADLKRLIRRPQ